MPKAKSQQEWEITKRSTNALSVVAQRNETLVRHLMSEGWWGTRSVALSHVDHERLAHPYVSLWIKREAEAWANKGSASRFIPDVVLGERLGWSDAMPTSCGILLDDAKWFPESESMRRYGLIAEIDSSAWIRMIGSALQALMEYCPERSLEVSECIKVIGVLQPPTTEVVSASIPYAYGAMVASMPESVLALATTLVHETSHNQLNVRSMYSPLSLSNMKRYYAPWRSDPRPLHSLVHGIYSFTQSLNAGTPSGTSTVQNQ